MCYPSSATLTHVLIDICSTTILHADYICSMSETVNNVIIMNVMPLTSVILLHHTARTIVHDMSLFNGFNIT